MTVFSQPKYPGDAVLLQQFKRGEEIGDVRIMQYGTPAHDKFRIACFLPGNDVCLPGDTPKTEPERDCWRNSEASARRVFGIYCRGAKQDGWIKFSAETANQAFANARLSLVDDILITAGWTQDAVGWIPPDRYRKAIEVHYGRGQWQRYNAIMFMVRADEAIAAGQIT